MNPSPMTLLSKCPAERDLEVLHLLHDEKWLKPKDVGGSDSSHHRLTLRRLVKQRLVEVMRYGTARGWQYRRTKTGKAMVAGSVDVARGVA